jgi:hypothetical protein
MLLDENLVLNVFFIADAFDPVKSYFTIHVLENAVDLLSFFSGKILAIIYGNLPLLLY